MFHSVTYQDNLIGVVVDKACCIEKWLVSTCHELRDFEKSLSF